MEKLDLRKQWKHLYQPSAKQVVVVDVPAFQFAMIDGVIEPDQSPGTSPAFAQAMEALYGISYTLKFASKLRKENPIDYAVTALEGLWGVEDGEFDITRPAGWRWTVMMMQPDHITPAMFAEALAQLRQETTQPRPRPTPFRNLPRGSVHPDHAYRPVCRGTCHHRQDGCLRPRARLHPARQAPRDLSGRPAPRRAGETQDRAASPDPVGVKRNACCVVRHHSSLHHSSLLSFPNL